jgi:UDP-N-acetylmuramate dehydrogenase
MEIVTDKRATDYDAIAAALGKRAKRNEPLSRHTSFRVGGPADILVAPATVEEITEALRLAREAGIPVLLLGAGSNMLVRDGGVRGMVIKILKNFSGIEDAGEGRLLARAGEPVARLSYHAAEKGLMGMEFAVGIPGTVGGGVATNAGAHGGEIGARVEWVEGVDGAGRPARLSREDLAFRYRSVRLPAGFVVTRALFALEPENPVSVLEKTRANLASRRATQPLNYPNAGCFFKNPAGQHASKLIDLAGLKGFRIGNLEVSKKHANFIVNLGGGTARDALRLVEEIRERVEKAHGVRIETEVMIVGEERA